MSNTKGARAALLLGATLVVVSWHGVSFAGTDGGGTAGISGGGTTGISGGGVTGISGGGTTGISGGGVTGISGGGTTGISGGGVTGISGGGTTGISGAGVIVLAGPVDSIDRLNGVFASMGQIVMASQDMLSSLRVGDFVSVGGSVAASGWLYADGISVSNQRYVPGATEVFVSGMLSSVNLTDGTAQMGGLTIDYTPSLGSVSAPSGAMWSFAGTRPGQGGVMMSDWSVGTR